ncbi:hypothetical protein ANAPC1_01043 [Anaplasma phagocytophilum]|uniref:Uncharacterized protein n=1 Tax=Anaplasma phagocytophilum TaxID=948 RepID=A0AA45ZHR1_ANAPH|nr:hypothetical protein [Anaplasma phagocytophilum]SBO14680.1 hypothetical protein ANAPC1_01043 [Anaplasma phagocytophilum]SBO33273.1 hypothetical protein ANAPC2_01307 [Anaplasma phagocytophilum]
MEISRSGIDEKVCKIESSNVYDASPGNDAGVQCGVGKSSGSRYESLKGFRTVVLEAGKGWPGSGDTGEARDNNAKKVAEDLIKLSSDKKNIVAGLLAKTIEGGEVVEIRAVSSTRSIVSLIRGCSG